MSSALSYYASKNRASERLENKRNEISRSSAYIIDNSSSNRSSYSSYGADSRPGRSTFRDRSTDYSARPRFDSIDMRTEKSVGKTLNFTH